METDYENYTLVNSCVGTPKNHIEWVYFLTREREWPDQNKALVSRPWNGVVKLILEFHEIFQVQELLYKINSEWGLDIDSLRVSPQDDCERFMDFIP